ncbi:unnamed protein product [Oncorhynchus mykiss]|uniref:Myosin tail domain-containing protein n=1 Tax=Oncorhynchus mykiss TaxID=8022 RepID=A0A060WKP4_ONCMY|nr:unnamed protein product [Oncorhynchus mykiss]
MRYYFSSWHQRSTQHTTISVLCRPSRDSSALHYASTLSPYSTVQYSHTHSFSLCAGQTHDLAIRCIQKNIKKNKGVKGWPWWKLFTTVRPLIEVQLTEEQIRGKCEEIQHLKGKLEKTEKERNEVRLNSDQLESRISELSAELADERNAGESASQLLETETSERLNLEKDMKDLQV